MPFHAFPLQNPLKRKSRKSNLSEEDIALFRREAGPVNPIRPNNRAEISVRRSPQHSSTRQIQREQTAAQDIFDGGDTGETTGEGELSFLRPGVQRTQLRKLRKGVYTFRSELDLHGMTIEEARQQLAIFLQECRRSGECYVRIVHGKGHHSPDRQPVLRGKVRQWLRQCDYVLAFCPAPIADGGAGALYVLLSGR